MKGYKSRNVDASFTKTTRGRPRSYAAEGNRRNMRAGFVYDNERSALGVRAYTPETFTDEGTHLGGSIWSANPDGSGYSGVLFWPL
jgi:hypothetical protein